MLARNKNKHRPLWFGISGYGFIVGLTADLFEGFILSRVKTIFCVGTKPVNFTFRSVLIFFDNIDVL